MTSRAFVVAGTGRSGTLFIARLLTSSGLPTSHELVFRPELGVSVAAARQLWKRRMRSYLPADTWLRPRLRALRRFVGEASWMSVPALPNLTCTRVVVVRNPIETVTSMLAKEFLNPPYAPKTKQLLNHYFQTTDDSLLDAARFWVQWTSSALAHCDLVVRLEDISVDTILEIAQRSKLEVDADRASLAIQQTPIRTNTHTSPDARRVAESLACGTEVTYKALWELASRLGYDA